MIIIKSATIFCLIALAHSATIRQADIPVEIRYEAKKSTGTELNLSGEDTISNDILKSSDANVVTDIKTLPVEPANSIIETSVSQLDGKAEEKPSAIIEGAVPFKKLPEGVKVEDVPQKISEEPITEGKEEQKQKPTPDQPLKPIDNVQKPEEQKIQILPDEPAQALKAVALEETISEEQPEKTTTLKEVDNGEKSIAQDETKNTESNVQEEKPQSVDMQLRIVPGIMSSVEKTEENLLQGTKSVRYESLLVQAKDIVDKGLKQLKESTTLKSGSKPVDWESLENRVNAYFDEEKRKLQTKDDQQQPPTNIFTNMVSQIQTIISGFVPQGNTPVSNVEGGTGGQSNPVNNFITFVSSGLSNIASSMGIGNGPPTSNTVLGDSTTSSPGGFIQTVFAGIQNFASGITSGGQQSGQTVSQGETGSGQQPQQPAILQPFQQIGNAINNAIRPPQVVSGEAGGEQQNIIQMIGQGINNAIKPFIPGGSQGSGATNQIAQSVAAPLTVDDGSKKPLSAAQPTKPEDAIPIAAQAVSEKESLPEKASMPEKAPLPEKPVQLQIMEIAQPAQPAAATEIVEPVKSTEPIKLPEMEKPVQKITAEKQSLPVSPIALTPEASSNTAQIIPEKEQKN